MKRIFGAFLCTLLCFSLAGCAVPHGEIAATTLPVAEFTERICAGTGLTVTRLVTEPVSCLHDYTLHVHQVKAAEAAEVIVTNGAGLEDFLDGVINPEKVIDASTGVPLLSAEAHDHEETHVHAAGHEHEETHVHAAGHEHEDDPHIWLSPVLAASMAANICAGLSARYPEYQPQFAENLASLLADLNRLQSYGDEALQALSCRELITFHDGFAYFAQSFHLTILEAVEEESGSEASAKELISLIRLTHDHHLPAIFTEENGSTSAASVISRETGANVFVLSMVMTGDSYFDAMYRNIDTIKEALG